MTIRYTATIELFGFPECDGERFAADMAAAIHQALRKFKSPLQAKDNLAVEYTRVSPIERMPAGSEELHPLAKVARA